METKRLAMNRMSVEATQKVNGGFRYVCSYCGESRRGWSPVTNSIALASLKGHIRAKHQTSAYRYSVKYW